MRSLEDLMRDKQFMSRMVWIGYVASLVFIGIGAFFILRDLFA